MPIPNSIAVTKLLLRKLKVKVSSSSLKQNLEDHPSYPSLLAISDCLTEWKIPNQAYKIAKEEYSVDELEFPFIAHLFANGGSFILVHQIANGEVMFSDENKSNSVKPESDFLNKWSGIALHALGNEESGEQEYQQKWFKEQLDQWKLPFFIFLIASILVFVLAEQVFNGAYLSLLLTKTVGVVVTILLLINSLDAKNPFIKNLCGLGKQGNCNAILKSESANVTSWLSWSEVGFFYYSGSFLSLIVNPTQVSGLAIMNLLALPFTVYSIGFQYRSKNWCILCCAVQLILWVEFFNFMWLNQYAFDSTYSVKSILLSLLCFAMPVVLWAMLKPVFLNGAQLKPVKDQLKKFKYNSELFSQALKSQPRYAVPADLKPIVLGNASAATTITMVSNPFCEPCAKAHQTIDEWLSYRDDIQLKIIFSTANQENDAKTKVARHISALSSLNDSNLTTKALNDWYNDSAKKYEIWALKYPIELNAELDLAVSKQREWCELAEIKFTPTILINGYKLPEPYRLEDIKYLLS